MRVFTLARKGGRTALLLEDPRREPLDRLIGAPVEAGRFLRDTIGIATASGKARQRGLVHEDVKPANILLKRADGRTRLTGFGIASRLQRERQAPADGAYFSLHTPVRNSAHPCPWPRPPRRCSPYGPHFVAGIRERQGLPVAVSIITPDLSSTISHSVLWALGRNRGSNDSEGESKAS